MSDSLAARMANLRLEAVVATEAADYDTAYAKLLAAQVIYDTTPNSEKDGLRMEWRSIEPLMKRLEKLKNQAIGSFGLQRVPVKFTLPDEC